MKAFMASKKALRRAANGALFAAFVVMSHGLALAQTTPPDYSTHANMVDPEAATSAVAAKGTTAVTSIVGLIIGFIVVGLVVRLITKGSRKSSAAM